MKGDTQVVVGVVVFFLGALVGYTVAGRVTPDLLAQTVAALVAAFSGAWVAFALENARRKREEQRAERRAAERTLMDLVHMWEDFALYEDEALKPLSDVPPQHRWHQLRPQLRPPPKQDMLDASKLTQTETSQGA